MFYGYDGAGPLHLAVEANSPATLCVLVDHGCDVNMKDRLGNTPAHHAARLNYIECIKILGSPQVNTVFTAHTTSNTPMNCSLICAHLL
jgi:ankyrin repeat protein